MPVVIKFLALNSPRLHPLFRGSTLQYLKVRFLIHREDHFAPLPQAVDALVIPEDFERPRDRLIIPHGGFPVAKAVGVQSRLPQNAAHCRVMNAVHIALINSGLGQTPLRLIGEERTYRSRLTPGHPSMP